MTSRREFLRVGLVATAFPVAARADIDFANLANPRPTVSLYKVLYDTRFSASVAFARRAAQRGLTVQGMAGDMTRFWYDDLYYRWREGPAAIAGLTGHGALFCLERLAWDQRMRVVYRGEHEAAADGCVAHRFEGSEPVLSAALRAMSDRRWAGALADVVAECVHGRAEARTARAVTRSAAVPPGEPLFSWLIAPAPRA